MNKIDELIAFINEVADDWVDPDVSLDVARMKQIAVLLQAADNVVKTQKEYSKYVALREVFDQAVDPKAFLRAALKCANAISDWEAALKE